MFIIVVHDEPQRARKLIWRVPMLPLASRQRFGKKLHIEADAGNSNKEQSTPFIRDAPILDKEILNILQVKYSKPGKL